MYVSECNIFPVTRKFEKTGQKAIFNIVVDVQTHRRLKAATAESGLKMGHVAALAINDWLDEEEKPARRRIRA